MTSIFRSIVHSSFHRSIQIGSFVQQTLQLTWVFLTDIADFTFTRTGDQYGIDSSGDLVKSTTDVSAFIFGEGVLLEGPRTNLFLNSFVPATQTVTVTAVPHTITVKGTGDITVSGVGSGVATEGSPLTITPTAGGLICTLNGSLDNVNLEAATFGSSFIETAGASASRADTSMTRAWPFPANGISGQIKVRPQFDGTVEKGDFMRILYMSNGTADEAELFYRQTDGRISMLKRLGGTLVEISSVDVGYSAGDELNIRFRFDSVGLHLWVDALSKVSITSGIAPTDWINTLTDIEIGSDSGGHLPAFQTVESLPIWNEAKSDEFLSGLT